MTPRLDEPWDELSRILDVQSAEGMRPTFPPRRVLQLSRREAEEVALSAAWALSYYRETQTRAIGGTT
ncbi:MAG TPA: hypothetical protein VLL25_18075 [Acidimicrobiales bacterium]|nr:hypothetical protein [Acidimicrobiales bacterium]